MKEAKYSFPQEPQGVTTQNTAFFIATAMKTSNFTGKIWVEEENVSRYSELNCSNNMPANVPTPLTDLLHIMCVNVERSD
jgi:hypothetical protein